jgi:hypothetical protein
MGRRTAETQYVAVTSEGITITSPVERLFLPVEEIERVKYGRFRRRMVIRTQRRRVKIRGVVEAAKIPAKVALGSWIASPAPKRAVLRAGMNGLKEAIEEMMSERPI